MAKIGDFFTMTRRERVGTLVVLFLLIVAIGDCLPCQERRACLGASQCASGYGAVHAAGRYCQCQGSEET
jgi:hypothetical protein